MKTRNTNARVLPAAVAAALAALGTPAFAEDEALQEIVVTAQSRTQSERDVPIAIQVIDQRQIEDLGAANLSTMNGYIPGLTVDGSQPTQPNFSLRGIGQGDFGIGTEAPVGIYVDGMYTGKTGGSLLNFDDVQRVEVLKGPQGTLFGRNSAAGAISIVTNEPEQATDAAAHVIYGRFQTIQFDGYANVPVTDTSAFRWSVASKNSNGWVTDQTTGEHMGGDGTWGSRMAYKWTSGADTKVIATWERESLNQPARPAFGLVEVPDGSAPPYPPTASEFVDPLTAPLQNDAINRETRDFDGLTLRIETPLAGMKFTSNSGWRHFRTFNQEDSDGTSNEVTRLSTTNAEVNSSFQQEFKLASQNDRLDWVAGASFYRVRADQVSTVDTTTDAIALDTSNTLGYDPFTLVDQQLTALGANATGLGPGNPWEERMVNAVRTTSYALYGDAIWHLTPATNLTVGMRETVDQKSVGWYVPPYYAPSLDAQYFTATGLAFGQGLTFGQIAGLTNIIFNSAAASAATPVSASHRWTNFSPRLVVDQKIASHTMVYASVSRGYQAGGYDVFNPFAYFEPERMTNYEAGIKGTLPEAHASYEASLFRYKFTNLQSITLVSAGVLPVYDVTTSNQSAYGLDLGGRWEATRFLSFQGAAEYLRQRYDQDTFIDHLTGATVTLDGQPTGTPLLTATAGMRLSWELAGGKAGAVLQGTHTTAWRCNTQSTEEFGCLDTGTVQTGVAQTRVDLHLSWFTEDRRFGVGFLVNNALNKQYLTAPGGESAWTLGTPYVSITPPRFVGVEVSAGL